MAPFLPSLANWYLRAIKCLDYRVGLEVFTKPVNVRLLVTPLEARLTFRILAWASANIEFHVGASTPFLFFLSFPFEYSFCSFFFGGGTSPCIVTSCMCVRVPVCVCEWIRNIKNGGERIEVSVIPKLSDRQGVVELGEFNNTEANFRRRISPRSILVFKRWYFFLKLRRLICRTKDGN